MMASREELLQSIRPGMQLNKDFFLRVYGYEISTPGFKEQVIAALESIGYSRAREYYHSVVAEYEKEHQESMKEVARWYREQLDREWAKKIKKRSEKSRRILQKMSSLELLKLLKSSITEG